MSKPLELIYSDQSGDYLPGRAYANPRYFTTARAGVTKVYMVGEWPAVRAAYEALGVPVERMDADAAQADPLASAAAPADLAGTIAVAFPARGLGDWDGDGKPGGDASAAEGLTKAEIIADLEGMGVEFDPRDKKADLLALRNEARAIRDA